MKAIPHTISLQSGHNRTPAFMESRAGNARAKVYEVSHESTTVCRIRVVDRTLLGCTCLRLRRTTRSVTQLYDRLLQPAGLTANQFGLLARLYAASLGGSDGISIGVMAESVGMDPTTLNRNLKPLEAVDWVNVVPDSTDARVRIVRMMKDSARCSRRFRSGAKPRHDCANRS